MLKIAQDHACQVFFWNCWFQSFQVLWGLLWLTWVWYYQCLLWCSSENCSSWKKTTDKDWVLGFSSLAPHLLSQLSISGGCGRKPGNRNQMILQIQKWESTTKRKIISFKCYFSVSLGGEGGYFSLPRLLALISCLAYVQSVPGRWWHQSLRAQPVLWGTKLGRLTAQPLSLLFSGFLLPRSLTCCRTSRLCVSLLVEVLLWRVDGFCLLGGLWGARGPAGTLTAPCDHAGTHHVSQTVLQIHCDFGWKKKKGEVGW